MFEKFHRGDIYSADLSPGIGSEQSGSRPVLILQNNVGNCFSPTIIIAAITSVSKKSRKFPTHYHLNDRCGLVKPSVVMLEQIRTIDKSRLKNYIGHLNKDDIYKSRKALLGIILDGQFVFNLDGRPHVILSAFRALKDRHGC